MLANLPQVTRNNAPLLKQLRRAIYLRFCVYRWLLFACDFRPFAIGKHLSYRIILARPFFQQFAVWIKVRLSDLIRGD